MNKYAIASYNNFDGELKLEIISADSSYEALLDYLDSIETESEMADREVQCKTIRDIYPTEESIMENFNVDDFYLTIKSFE